MSDDCKDKLRIEAYKQCFVAKHHYDILSWSIAGGSLVFVGLIIATILQVNLSVYGLSVAVRLVLAIIAIAVVRAWHSIYERNRFWGEVANETARDIERELGINGPAISFMKGALDNEVILKNLDEYKKTYKGKWQAIEKCASKSMHKSITFLMWCLIFLTLIAVFIPSPSPNRSEKDRLVSPPPTETHAPNKEKK